MLPVDIARELKVTPAAITKKLKAYRPHPAVQKYLRARGHEEEPASGGTEYTEKKGLYVAARVAGEKPVEAARLAYDCDNPQSARVISCRLEKDATVQRAMKDCLVDAGITNPYRAKKLFSICEQGSMDHQLKALDHVAKLNGDYEININLKGEIDATALAVGIAERQARINALIGGLRSLCSEPAHEIDITPKNTPVQSGKLLQGE